MNIKVAFLILAVFCQHYCVNGWWFTRRSSSRRSSSSGRRSVRKPRVPKPSTTTCDLTYYRGSEFTNKAPRVHTGFLTHIRNINSYAKQCKVTVYITSSYRRTTRVKGAIVTPATKSNHLIGHAIDMNLIDKRTGKFCNSRCLRGSNKPVGVTCFIGKIKSSPSLRWGGDFRPSDPVHIDDGTNIKNSQLWSRIYNSVQKNCR